MAAALASCASWPPLQAGAIAHFTEHRVALERLAEAVIADDLEYVYLAELNRVVLMKEPLPTNLLEKYRDLFADARNISAVFRSGSTLRFDLEQSHDVGPTRYLFYYVRGDPQSPIPGCETIEGPTAEGRCSIMLDSNWRFVYQWYRERE